MIELFDNNQLPLTYTTRNSEDDYPLVHGSLQFRNFKKGNEVVRRIVVVFTAFIREGKMPEDGLNPYFAPILAEFAKSLKHVIFENTYSERGTYYIYYPGDAKSTVSFNRSPLVMRYNEIEDLLDS
jgi:hypothetical protein